MILFDDLDQVRESIETSIGDDALVSRIEDAEAAIDRVGGPLGERVEERPGRNSRVVILSRQAASVRRIREDGETADLGSDNWRLEGDRRSLTRLDTGSSPASAWIRPLIYFQPLDDLATRRAVAIELVKGGLTSMPGVLGFTEGNWTIQYANGQTWSSSRDDALGQVGPEWGFA